MKTILRALALSLVSLLATCTPPLQAASPTTGQFLFQQKPSTGPFTPFGVTPVTGYAFGWDGTNVVMLAPGGGASVAWGAITGTLSAQTDLQTALNLKLSLAGTLPLAGFGSITGALPDANLSANVQLENGVLALAGFSSITGTLPIANVPSITDAKLSANVQLKDGTLGLAGFSSVTGTLADARLSANVQLEDGVLGLAGFSSITGTLPIANVPSITDAKLSANVQLKDGTLALNGFGSVTGTLAAARIADLSGTYLTVAAAASGYQPLDADLTAIAALSGTNNLYYRSGAGAWSNVAFGSGLSFSGGTLSVSANGTVTSVALTAPNIFSVSGSPVTTTGTLALSLASQTANTIFAAPNGSTGTPSFRALAAADIPSLSAVYQPLDAGLTSIGGVSTTNKLYYLSAADTWTAVTVGTGLTFSAGTLANSVTGLGTVTSVSVTTANGISGTVATNTTTPAITLSLGDVTPLSVESIGDISTTDESGRIYTNGTSAEIFTVGTSADFFTQGAGAGFYTLGASGSFRTYGTTGAFYALGTSSTIQTRNTFKLHNGTFFTTLSHAPTADRAIVFPDAAGTIALIAQVQPIDADLTSWALVTRAAGFDTFVATPTGENLATLLTTALPATKGGTGLTALGTGIATALAVNVGSAGAPVVFNGALGTPSSGTINANFLTGTLPALNGAAITAINATNIASGTLADTRLPATAQLTNGTLALAGFSSITGTLAAARIGDLSATYLTVAAALAGYQPLDADLTSWATVTRAAGYDTFAATPSSANMATLVTNETGSGALVFATSPTFVTPVLGTPASGTATNLTGLPIATGVSGLGTGVATALAVNVGSAGAPVVFNGALGTPTSGTVTNLTGTASINVNGTVGATTPTTGAFTTVAASGASTLTGVVGIGGAPNANAMLDVQSTTKAFMPPRMTTTERNAIPSPTAGMVIYNSTTNKLNVYTTTWEAVTSI